MAIEQAISFSADEVARAKAKLLDLMDANVVVRGTERNAEGRCVYIEVANQPIQLAAAIKVVEWGIGKPSQMVVVDQTESYRPARADLGKMLVANPSLIETVLRTIKEAAEQSQAIPVQSVVSDRAEAAQESIS